MNIVQSIRKELKEAGNESYAKTAQRFFKTGKGEYGEGDIFIGVRVPLIKKIALTHYKESSLENIEELLSSGIHEERTCSLSMLVLKYRAEKKDESQKKKIFNFYMKNSRRINNWDLVDMSAPYIPGDYLFDRDRSMLEKFARSENLWKKRISIITTHGFIKRGDIAHSFLIADILLNDRHDLMHKAVGWTLRETGKKDEALLEKYLKSHYKTMPRTMLRYAIEKFSESKREKYLNGRI
jgi:3-methyladenine DNA glycosylase AlkD